MIMDGIALMKQLVSAQIVLSLSTKTEMLYKVVSALLFSVILVVQLHVIKTVKEFKENK